jgi:hypothetical protein
VLDSFANKIEFSVLFDFFADDFHNNFVVSCEKKKNGSLNELKLPRDANLGVILKRMLDFLRDIFKGFGKLLQNFLRKN